MVEFNKQKEQFTITLGHDVSDIVARQKALINLIKLYPHDEGYCKETIYYAASLLEEMLPNDEQQYRAFIMSNNSIELPGNITENQKKQLSQAFAAIEHPHIKIKDANKVLEALKAIDK